LSFGGGKKAVKRGEGARPKEGVPNAYSRTSKGGGGDFLEGVTLHADRGNSKKEGVTTPCPSEGNMGGKKKKVNRTGRGRAALGGKYFKPEIVQ